MLPIADVALFGKLVRCIFGRLMSLKLLSSSSRGRFKTLSENTFSPSFAMSVSTMRMRIGESSTDPVKCKPVRVECQHNATAANINIVL